MSEPNDTWPPTREQLDENRRRIDWADCNIFAGSSETVAYKVHRAVQREKDGLCGWCGQRDGHSQFCGAER